MKRGIWALLAVWTALALGLGPCAAASAQTTELTYESRGVDVPATLVLPDGLERYPMVVLCHSHGGSRDEWYGFGAIADALAARGIASIRMDFSGCGDSEESFQQNTLSNMKADVRAAIAYVYANTGADALGLAGYSMGGRVVLELLAEGLDAQAVALLAPANDTEDLKRLFGGSRAYAEMWEIAKEDGYADFTTPYTAILELSLEWFEALAAYASPAEAAARVYDGPALVVWGEDDEAVAPSVSAAVAAALGAETLDATGEGHSYGFYSDDDAVRSRVALGMAGFFGGS